MAPLWYHSRVSKARFYTGFGILKKGTACGKKSKAKRMGL